MEDNVFSRSEIVTLDECPLKAYQTYREDGHGYVPTGQDANLSALQGIALHKGSETIFNHGPDSDWRQQVSSVLLPLDEPHRTLRTTLVRRALLGWSLLRYPQISAEWKSLSSEVPWKWELAPNLFQPLRLDDFMEHRETRALGIRDLKSAGAPDLNWTERKRISKQTHLYLRALQEVVGQRAFVAGIIYDVLVVGKWDNKTGVLKSPFVTGYTKNGKVSPKWVAGSQTTSLLDLTDDEWLQWAQSTNALDGLYWTTELILPDQAQLVQTQEATATQLTDYRVKLKRVENSLDKWSEAKKQFPRNPDACLKYGWEHKCAFIGRCWKGHQLDAEAFEARKDHHFVEPD
jgi:hypothetical protein